MTEFLNQEPDLYTIAAVTELIVLSAAAFIYIKYCKAPEEETRSFWTGKKMLSLYAVVLLTFSPVNILGGSKGTPIIFFCMLFGSIIAAADAAITFTLHLRESKEKDEKENQ